MKKVLFLIALTIFTAAALFAAHKLSMGEEDFDYLYAESVDPKELKTEYIAQTFDLKNDSNVLFFDLDEDGDDEIIKSQDSFNAKTMLAKEYVIFKKTGDTYKKVSSFIIPAETLKIYILKAKTDGWHNLLMLNPQTKNLDIYEHLRFSKFEPALKYAYTGVNYDKEAIKHKDTPVIKKLSLNSPNAGDSQALAEFSQYLAAKNIEVYKHALKAVYFDLDNDKINEIIAFDSSQCGLIACPYYILKKFAQNKYYNICDDSVTPDTKEILVLKTKTNGFYDIGLTTEADGLTYRAVTKFKENPSPYNENYAYQYVYDVKENSEAAKKEFFKEFSFKDKSQNDPEAEEILWQFQKKEAVEVFENSDINEDSDEEKFHEKTGLVRNNFAIKFDLDDDGQDEIIGINDNQLYCGRLYNCFYILKKYDDGYKNLANLLLNREFSKFRILKTKSGGFWDIYAMDTSKRKIIRYKKKELRS